LLILEEDLSKFKEIGEGLQEEEIESASLQELSSLAENTDPLAIIVNNGNYHRDQSSIRFILNFFLLLLLIAII
jgi:hypothetical protein